MPCNDPYLTKTMTFTDAPFRDEELLREALAQVGVRRFTIAKNDAGECVLSITSSSRYDVDSMNRINMVAVKTAYSNGVIKKFAASRKRAVVNEETPGQVVVTFQRSVRMR